jgi:hypothetical protein
MPFLLLTASVDAFLTGTSLYAFLEDTCLVAIILTDTANVAFLTDMPYDEFLAIFRWYRHTCFPYIPCRTHI